MENLRKIILKELYKSTYNRAAAKAVEREDEELALDFLSHSNDMGIEDKGSYNKRNENYMFFQNLKEIRDNIDTLLNMNESEVDQILSNGHDWATEHIATAKDDIEEVTNFLKYRR